MSLLQSVLILEYHDKTINTKSLLKQIAEIPNQLDAHVSNPKSIIFCVCITFYIFKQQGLFHLP